jgi:hypothetical protein
MELTTNRLSELTIEECWALLGTASVGRIAWSTNRGPEVIPVNFALDGHDVHIRTGGYSAMAQKVDVERVALQVDQVDEQAHTGWSVLARGRAEVRYGEPTGAPMVTPWPDGPRSATVVIAIDEISGRRLDAVDDTERDV